MGGQPLDPFLRPLGITLVGGRSADTTVSQKKRKLWITMTRHTLKCQKDIGYLNCDPCVTALFPFSVSELQNVHQVSN